MNGVSGKEKRKKNGNRNGLFIFIFLLMGLSFFLGLFLFRLSAHMTHLSQEILMFSENDSRFLGHLDKINHQMTLDTQMTGQFYEKLLDSQLDPFLQNSLYQLLSASTDELTPSIQSSSSVSAPLDDKSIRQRALNTLVHSPYDQDSLTKLGTLSYERGDFSSSLDYFSKVIDVDPDNGDAILTAAKSAFGMGDYQNALFWGNQLLRKENNAFNWIFLGKCHFQNQEYMLSLQAAEKALLLNETSLDALELGSRASFSLGDYNSSEYYYLRAAAIKPDSNYYRALGDLALLSDRFTDSYNYWEKGASLNPLKTQKDLEEQLSTYEKMAYCAFELKDDGLLADCSYYAEKLGGSDAIKRMQNRREKSQEEDRKE